MQFSRSTDLWSGNKFRACNKSLQRLQKFLINVFVIFVNVYYFNYFNRRYTKCRRSLSNSCRLQRSMTRSQAFYLLNASEPETDWLRRIEIYKTLTLRFCL